MNSEVDGKEGEEMNPGGDSASTSSSTENPKDGLLSSHPERIQLYKPAMSSLDRKEMNEILNRIDLTEDDYDIYLSGGNLPPMMDDEHEEDIRIRMRRDFHKRRREIQELSQKLATGEARIDEDGRLVLSEPPRPPNAHLPPHPPAGQRNNNNQNRIAPLVEDLMLNGPGFNQQGNNGNGNNQEDIPNLTFRRICFAVLAVVTAFVCVILRTIPLMEEMEGAGTSFDSLLHELFHVKFMKQHLKHCSNLNRDPPHLQPWNVTNVFSVGFWQDRLILLSGQYSEGNCDDGVLHIPSRQVLADDYWYSDRQEALVLEPYRQGVDHVWNLPCVTPPRDSSVSKCYPGWNNNNGDGNEDQMKQETCPNGFDSKHQCFRGIHDGVISQDEALAARNLGHRYILNGSDHFDVHYNTDILQQELPTIMQKLQTLLREKYQQTNLQAVAFRFQIAGPMDFVGVDLNSYASVGLNVTNYLSWGEKCRRQNEMASYSLPWPFRIKPARDPCKLMADLEADPRFAVHTSVFLTSGAGEHYRGGVTLFADNHHSNYRPKHKIRRGVTIDGSLGRVMVASGGIENRRCRMPTRAGLRRVLQIWWDCRADE